MTSKWWWKCTSWAQSSWSSSTMYADVVKIASRPNAVARGNLTASWTLSVKYANWWVHKCLQHAECDKTSAFRLLQNSRGSRRSGLLCGHVVRLPVNQRARHMLFGWWRRSPLSLMCLHMTVGTLMPHAHPLYNVPESSRRDASASARPSSYLWSLTAVLKHNWKEAVAWMYVWRREMCEVCLSLWRLREKAVLVLQGDLLIVTQPGSIHHWMLITKCLCMSVEQVLTMLCGANCLTGIVKHEIASLWPTIPSKIMA